MTHRGRRKYRRPRSWASWLSQAEKRCPTAAPLARHYATGRAARIDLDATARDLDLDADELRHQLDQLTAARLVTICDDGAVIRWTRNHTA